MSAHDAGGGQRVALDSPKLNDVLKDVAGGTLQLPDFQRDWKWDDQRIRELIATVTLDAMKERGLRSS